MRDGTRRGWLPGFAILAGWNDGSGAVGGHAAHLVVGRDLARKVGQHRRIANVVPGDLDRSDLQRLLVDPEVDLAPDAPFGPAMLACVPRVFALDLDAGAVRCPAGCCAARPERGSAGQGSCEPQQGMFTTRVF